MKVNLYPAPLRLQQKTGQVAYRHSHNLMYFIGGTDVTYTFYSRKVFKFDFTEKKVSSIGNLNVARAGFCTIKLNVRSYVFRLIFRIGFMSSEDSLIARLQVSRSILPAANTWTSVMINRHGKPCLTCLLQEVGHSPGLTKLV